MYDVAILGGGPGGYAAALFARNYNLNVALVEAERPGGTCLIRGCIPTKQLLETAAALRDTGDMGRLGVSVEHVELDWSAAMRRKQDTVEGLVNGLGGLLKQRGVDVITGHGRLVGPDTLQVVAAEGTTTQIEAKSLVVATGARPRTLPGFTVDGSAVVTSDEALEWKELPARVAIVGAGVIGCEFASMLCDLGSQVHVFEVAKQILPGADRTGSKYLQNQLRRRGVTFHLGAATTPPVVTADAVTIGSVDAMVEVDSVLVAVGRAPNTADIGLETLGVDMESGSIRVNRETMETSIGGVYAVGDVVAGTPQLAHVAFAEGIAAAVHIATGATRPVPYDVAPRVVYTHPEYAELGRVDNGDPGDGEGIISAKHALNGNAKAIISGSPLGFSKIYRRPNGPVVGASLVAPMAGELINELMYLVGWQATPEEASEYLHAHPSVSEVIGESLMDATGMALH
ncbi:dihydrolipoyl dehydrogenase [Euzebya pacifica]|uniref:dihydrolipoyl dehydrogenase n=1 Tax=Euzebya pacifica TaxID=1608957 RepID=UPI0030F5F547